MTGDEVDAPRIRIAFLADRARLDEHGLLDVEGALPGWHGFESLPADWTPVMVVVFDAVDARAGQVQPARFRVFDPSGDECAVRTPSDDVKVQLGGPADFAFVFMPMAVEIRRAGRHIFRVEFDEIQDFAQYPIDIRVVAAQR